MVDILLKIVILIMVMILSQIIHETAHFIVVRLQWRFAYIIFGIGKQIIKTKFVMIKLFPIMACVETNVDWLKDKRAYYMAGALGQILFSGILGMIGFGFDVVVLNNLALLFVIYGVMNLIPIVKENDMFVYLYNEEKNFYRFYNNLHWIIQAIWMLLGYGIVFVGSFVMSWILLF